MFPPFLQSLSVLPHPRSCRPIYLGTPSAGCASPMPWSREVDHGSTKTSVDLASNLRCWTRPSGASRKARSDHATSFLSCARQEFCTRAALRTAISVRYSLAYQSALSRLSSSSLRWPPSSAPSTGREIARGPSSPWPSAQDNYKLLFQRPSRTSSSPPLQPSRLISLVLT